MNNSTIKSIFAAALCAVVAASCSQSSKPTSDQPVEESSAPNATPASVCIPGRTITDAALAFANAVCNGDQDAALAHSAHSLKYAVRTRWNSFNPEEFETNGKKPESWLWADVKVRISSEGEANERALFAFLDEDGKWVAPTHMAECTDYPEGVPETIDVAKALDAVAEAVREKVPAGIKLDVVDSFLVGTVRFPMESGRNQYIHVVQNEAGEWVAVRNTDLRDFLGRTGGTAATRAELKAKTIPLTENVSLEMVKLPNGVWFGKYEVTHSQWESLMGKPSYDSPANNPVDVSWDDCQQFIKALNSLPAAKESGIVFRLPTEEEWRFACLAGANKLGFCKLADGTEMFDNSLEEVGWFSEPSSNNPLAYLALEPHSVGEKKANAFGLFDMLGNVEEWTQTAYDLKDWYKVFGGSVSTDLTKCYDLDEAFLSGKGTPSGFSECFRGFRICADDKTE